MYRQKDLYCLEWRNDEIYNVHGSFSSSDYAVLDIMLLSCNTKIVNPEDGTVLNGINNEDCVQDKDEVANYLGTKFNFIYYYN